MCPESLPVRVVARICVPDCKSAAPDVKSGFACTCKQPAAAVLFRIFASEQPQQYACSMTTGGPLSSTAIQRYGADGAGGMNNDRLPPLGQIDTLTATSDDQIHRR